MPRSNQSGGPWGSGPPGSPDLEEFLRRSQDRLRGLMSGNLGGRGFALLALAAVVLWGFSTLATNRRTCHATRGLFSVNH